MSQAEEPDSTRAPCRIVLPPTPAAIGFAPLFTAALTARISELSRQTRREPAAVRRRRVKLADDMRKVQRRARRILARDERAAAERGFA